MSIKKNPDGEGLQVTIHRRINGKRYHRQRVAKGYFKEDGSWVKPKDHAVDLQGELLRENQQAAADESIVPRGNDIPSIEQLVGQYINYTFPEITASRKVTQARLKHFVLFSKAEGILYLHQFTVQKAQKFWDYLFKKFTGAGPYSKFDTATSLILFAINKQVKGVSNPMKLVQRPDYEMPDEERWIDDELFDAMMEAAKMQDEEAQWVYDILSDTGMRRDELRMLPRHHIDLRSSNPMIRIAKFTDDRGRKWKPKTPTSKRYIPPPMKAIVAIEKFIAKYPECYYLIPSLRGAEVGRDPKLDPRGVNWYGHRFEDLRQKTIEQSSWTRASLQEKLGKTNRYAISLHSFRHTYASWLLRDGLDPHLIGDLMGHTGVFITRRYAKFSKPDLHRAARVLTARAIRKNGTDTGTVIHSNRRIQNG